MFACHRRDWFCFVCGEYTLVRNRKHRNAKSDESYRAYFEMEWIEEEWTPRTICTVCYNNLIEQKGKAMSFSIPMRWYDPGNHVEQNCYFCVNRSFGHSSGTRHTIKYVATPFSRLPIAHSDERPIPEPLTDRTCEMENVASDIEMDIEPIPGPSSQSGSSYHLPNNA